MPFSSQQEFTAFIGALDLSTTPAFQKILTSKNPSITLNDLTSPKKEAAIGGLMVKRILQYSSEVKCMQPTDAWLFGHDPLLGIVAVHANLSRQVWGWQRSGQGVFCEQPRFCS